MTQITTKEEQAKDSFVKILRGKQVPRDMFGTIINIGDILVFGSGSQSASALKFGRVEKINYNGVDRETGEEKLSSVTITPVERRWNPKTQEVSLRITNKRGLTGYKTSWVITNVPPIVSDALAEGQK